MFEPAHEGFHAGLLVGPYRVVRRLGAGGMGAVYEAVHERIGKRVAIKVLLPQVVNDHVVVTRLVREAQAAVRVHHPNVVDVHDVDVFESMPYLVMEFLEGEDLGAVLDREKKLPLERAIGILLPVIAAVSAAHSEGVVHRDLKPQNVFLVRTRDGEIVPKVLDFGISKVREGAYGDPELTAASMPVFDPDAAKTTPGTPPPSSLTQTGWALGTPYYMPPEQIRSAKHVEAPADQWSLAVMLFECVTGEMPMAGGTPIDVMQQIMAGALKKPREANPALPPAFEAALLRAFEQEPAARYPSMRAFGAALLPFATSADRARWRSLGMDAGAFGAVPTAGGSSAESAGPSSTLAGHVTGVGRATPLQRKGLVAAAGLFVATLTGVAVWHSRTSTAPPRVAQPALLARPTVTTSPPPTQRPARPSAPSPAPAPTIAPVAPQPSNTSSRSSRRTHAHPTPHAASATSTSSTPSTNAAQHSAGSHWVPE